MSSIYIDPSAGTNGDGSVGSPYNTVASLTLVGGNEYLLKRGTTLSEKWTIARSGSGVVTISSYGTAAAKPIIAGDNTYCIYASGLDDFLIDDIGFTTSANAVYLVSGCSNWTIRNCDFTAHDQRGIYIGSATELWNERNTVEHCTFTNIGDFDDTSSSSLAAGPYIRNFDCKNCTFIGNGTTLGVDGILVAHCTEWQFDINIEDCYFSGLQENGIDIKGLTTGVRIRRCTFEDGVDEGHIHIHWTAQGIDIEECVFTGGPCAVAFIDVTDNNDNGRVRMRNCVAHDIERVWSDAQTTGESLGCNEISNCTFYQNGVGNSNNRSFYIKGPNNVLRNNVFYNQSIDKDNIHIQFADNDDFASATLEGNCYHNDDAADIYYVNTPADSGMTLAELQAAGKEEFGIAEDPLFVDIDHDNYRLAFDSPCKGKGANLMG